MIRALAIAAAALLAGAAQAAPDPDVVVSYRLTGRICLPASPGRRPRPCRTVKGNITNLYVCQAKLGELDRLKIALGFVCERINSPARA